MEDSTLRIYFTLSLLLLSGGTYACSCSLGDVEKKYNDAEKVFVGTVSSVEYTGGKNFSGDKNTVVKFDVKSIWKGKEKVVVLNTVDNGSSCEGYWFKNNHTYLVYAYENKTKLTTYYCGGVIPESERDLFKQEVAVVENIGENTHNKSN